MKIAEFLLRTLEAQGVRCLFGNPGTTEIPLVRLADHRAGLRYAVALSEIAAVPMADGYARATRSLGVVNLHVAPGLGNGMGALYTARIAKTPLLVVVGGQDRRFLHTDPILYGPLEEMARPVCKAVVSLARREDAVFNIRKAIRAALTPPTGPVALICPPDLLEEEVDETAAAAVPPALGTLSADDAAAYAAFLRTARSPALIAAEDVHWAGAGPALQSLAESLGAPVYAAPYTGMLPVASGSPCFAGYLSPSFRAIAERLRDHDALLFAGWRNFRTTLYAAASLPQRKAWLGADPESHAGDGEFELARVADLRDALLRIGAAFPTPLRPLPAGRPAVEVPAASAGVLHPTRAIVALLEAYPDALVVDESGLSTSDVRQFVAAAAGDYLINGSGGIGWGLAAAVGAALGRPDRQVLALIGDGSALYASEALWTAAHLGTRVLLVVLGNRRYATLNAAAGRITGQPIDLFTIEPPVLDFSGLARLHGWQHLRADNDDALAAFLRAHPGRVETNTLLELVLDPAVEPVTASRHF